ncbi:superoxide dismutase [Candidatus Shikimatogenerans silvanidophilus]|uniref:superoxide dismutase n=1 Tax=Candidatus Shikimatogenerans silvanidophilus TaxID=2782547 RepID=UPI001BA6016E|nr:superoxide dismutase [Candidatus Shikimatogenerans silvanidophilus]
MEYKLPNLNYSYDYLEPYIDSKTMEIHHTKHHKTYIDNLNKAIKSNLNLSNKSLEEILKLSKQDIFIKNNAGGVYNHNFFWNILGKNYKINDISFFIKDINKYFGSFENFKKNFTKVSLNHFGSGWIWLCISKNNELIIGSTPNQDNPLMPDSNIQGIPILGLDVWEHAYYLKYQNRRIEYIKSFWNIINWKYVENLYNKNKK